MKQLTSIFLIFCLYACGTNEPKVLFELAVTDGSTEGFALAPDKHDDFLAHDFGWEDKFFIVGLSDPKEDWPYILPGPDDRWGGTSGTAGLRTHVLNLLFSLQDVPEKGDWQLIVDLADIQRQKPPLFKVTINGQSWKYKTADFLPPDEKDSLKRKTIEIPFTSDLIKKGNNEIQFTNLEGSWVAFDNISLVAPGKTKLQKPDNTAYLRGVRPANYHTIADNVQRQPLLVDIEYLSGSPLLTVELDGTVILEQVLEEGRYELEAPMPIVEKDTESNYIIKVDGKKIQDGTIVRSSQDMITPADYVDTMIGTAHSRWMIAPGPWMPFSMVKLSPDNQNSGWQAGYQPTFESIGTFSHIHEWTMTGLGTFPANGPLKTKVGDQSSRIEQNDAYRSAIDKSTEEAALGYYKVKLTDYDITAELTATTRCSFQRYTYPKGEDSRVMIDLKIPTEYGYDILDAEIKQVSPNRIEGYSKQHSKGVWSRDADQDYNVFFVIEFDKNINKFGGWVNDDLSENSIILAKEPKRVGAYVEFDTREDQVVQMRTGISYVDIAGASGNLEKEVAEPFGWNFDKVHQHQVDTWNELLQRIDITSNDSREKKRFYTNMYRSFCRNAFSDVDGRWVDATEKVRQYDNPDNVALGCDAFWNTFWNLNQLWNLISPEWSSRWVRSQLGMFDANGWLAKGPAGIEYIPVMVAEHEIPLLVSAYQMGIRDYDVDKMYTAVKKMQMTPAQSVGNGLAGNRDLKTYLKHKYVPADEGRFSNTLEYSYDDWTVSQLAKALGKESDYQYFADRGNWWRNAIDKETGYARMRYANGEWEKEFDPFKSGANHHYVEGNSWQLTFFVPQDVPALAEAIGKDRFIERLQWGFEQSEGWRYNAPGDQYWDFPVVQGNQQSMHFAFLFNWVGLPWETQRWSRSILDRYYGFELANAYLGDEDQGQMSAWFVMAAIGLFQTDGGCSTEPVYEIASPLYEKITLDLGERYGRGKEFTIVAEGASKKNKYVQSAELDGKPLNSFKFPAKELLKGGTLKLIMGDKPNTQWGVE
ncbi:MAG: GH92 family glycosyl hydrolase [Prevotella sp.]|jgi:predicted alpha-1,2-mannosidase|nr:GH92 family glycosyl hydrolase [Prevotella sp.]